MLTGGSDSKSESSQSSNSGLLALPAYAQTAYEDLVKQATGQLGGGQGSQYFTPIGQTATEAQAAGLAQLPTNQQGVQSLVSQYLNPYMDSAYDTINKQATGQYSLLKQSLANSGQMGSNREYLQAGATDEARLNAIANAQREGYNTALNTGLNQNQQNIQNLTAQGADERNLASQTTQAPLAALQMLAQLLGTLPSTSTSTGSSSGTSSSVGGFLPALAQFGGK